MARLVFVHGSATSGRESWATQCSLSDRYELAVLERPGFPGGPPGGRVDFDEHAAWLADLLRAGDHVVGHSYGGVVALLAAAERPDLASLTVIEPPCLTVAVDDPAVAEFIRGGKELWEHGPADSAEFLRRFLGSVGFRWEPPSPLPAELHAAATVTRAERPPWEATIPLARLRASPFRTLVVSGGHHPAFDAVCDVLERELEAERVDFPRTGHAVQFAPGFNERLVAFLKR
ncbi:MAG: alpha/beta hydrolase [Actinobacteria bacterium]|nr:alpha/beta hydrolase [Actinomycetota bacterium]